VEYKLHLPLAGVAVCFGFTIAELRNALPGKRKLLIIPPIVLLVIWGALMSAVRNADWRDPVVLWAKAESLAPDKARPPLMKGTHIYQKAHRETDNAKKGWLYEEAAQAFLKAAKNYSNNPLHPNSIYTLAYSNLAMLEFRRGRLTEAVKYLEFGVGVRPENDHLIRGSVAMEEGRYADAEKQFKQSLGADRTYLETLKQYTVLLVKLSRFPEAADYASRTIRYYPGNPELRLRLADVRLQQKDYSQAQSIIGAIQREYPKYPQAHLAMSIVALQVEEPDEAIESLDKAISLGLNTWQVYWLRGKAFMQMERLNEAQEALQKSITLAPKVRQPRLKLAEVFQKKKDYSAALEQYLGIREIRQETIEVSNAIAGMLYKLQRNEEAIKEYLAAEKKAPESCDIQLGLALTYLQLDKKVDACTAARKAIALGINPEKLPEYLRELLQETPPRKP
jgi:tetratricopeptide (TPR) repeat protein